MHVVCTLLVEVLSEETEKSICDLMANTIHSIAIHNFPGKWSKLLSSLLGQIYFNVDLSQSL